MTVVFAVTAVLVLWAQRLTIEIELLQGRDDGDPTE